MHDAHTRAALMLSVFLVSAAPIAHAQAPSYTEPTPPADCVEYSDAQPHAYPTRTVWRQMCSGTPGVLSADDLAAVAGDHHGQMADRGHIVVIDTPRDGGLRSAGVNIVFNINPTNAPAGYATAFSLAEQYIESKFTNPITVSIDISWASLPSGVLGATGSSYVSNV